MTGTRNRILAIAATVSVASSLAATATAESNAKDQGGHPTVVTPGKLGVIDGKVETPGINKASPGSKGHPPYDDKDRSGGGRRN
jgi:hypothetical protein